MRRNLRWLVFTAVALVGVACADTDTVLSPEAEALASRGSEMHGGGSQQSTAQFEIRWMQNMIDHHHMAVMMAEICLQKAVHPELKTLCENIIAAQTREIRQMQGWLRDWYGITYEPQMKPGDMRQMEKMAALSPTEFEIAFMEEMIRHHRMAIMEAQMALRKASHEELKQLARDIIRTQSQEIQQMRTWLCQWYNRCRGMEMGGGMGMGM